MTDERKKSLYERIGGKKAIMETVERLYFKILIDPTLSAFFSYDKMETIKRHQVAYLTMATGGPHEYTGKDLRSAHAPLLQQGLTDSHFDGVKNHLGEVLSEQGFAPELIAEALAVVETMRGNVLGRD